MARDRTRQEPPKPDSQQARGIDAWTPVPIPPPISAAQRAELAAMLEHLHAKMRAPLRYQAPRPMAHETGSTLPEEQPGDRERLEERRTEALERYRRYLRGESAP